MTDMRIGIELVSSMKIVNGIASYTGGTNYAKGVIKSLKSSSSQRAFTIILFISAGFQPTAEDIGLFFDDICEIRYTETLQNCDYTGIDIMFFPQVNGITLRLIPEIKRKNPNMKICATLHDRQHNFYQYDWKDRFYYDGFRRTGIPGFLSYYIKRMAFAYEYGKCVKYIDKIFTVSNYSMQRLMHKNVNSIQYFIQENIVEEAVTEEPCKGEYILLVGGGRPEKNLLRTIEAFCKFKKESRSKVIFKVTGVNEQTKNNLLRALEKDRELIEKTVEFMPYLTYKELSSLYIHCRYVIFISKGEGYGLPVREAMTYGKAVLASRITSIPEVAGASIYYVDPFSIDSICEGMKFFDNGAVLDRYEGYIQERNSIIKELCRQDTKILIDELLEW